MPNILITGASSGIGAALARAYAVPDAHLVLWGRDAQRLDATAAECRGRGASVETACFDLRDIARMSDQLRATDARTPLDLAIFNAGLGGISPPERPVEAPERAHDVATVNFTAPVVGAAVAGELMAGRGRGQIAFIGSIADSFPLPMAPTYAGSKAGLAMFADALRMQLVRHGVRVTLVSPGFVDTPMSQDIPSPKPFMMTTEAAAAIIVRAVAQRQRRVVMPWPFALVRALSRALPSAVTRAVLRRL